MPWYNISILYTISIALLISSVISTHVQQWNEEKILYMKTSNTKTVRLSSHNEEALVLHKASRLSCGTYETGMLEWHGREVDHMHSQYEMQDFFSECISFFCTRVCNCSSCCVTNNLFIKIYFLFATMNWLLIMLLMMMMVICDF